jgi:hypothetical protein
MVTNMQSAERELDRLRIKRYHHKAFREIASGLVCTFLGRRLRQIPRSCFLFSATCCVTRRISSNTTFCGRVILCDMSCREYRAWEACGGPDNNLSTQPELARASDPPQEGTLRAVLPSRWRDRCSPRRHADGQIHSSVFCQESTNSFRDRHPRVQAHKSRPPTVLTPLVRQSG